MAKTGAERQAEYRKARKEERRINTWVSKNAFAALQKLSIHHNLTQRQMIEQLITTAEEQVFNSLSPDPDIQEKKRDE